MKVLTKRVRVRAHELRTYYRFEGPDKTNVIMALDLAIVTLDPPEDSGEFRVVAQQLSPDTQKLLAGELQKIRAILAR